MVNHLLQDYFNDQIISSISFINTVSLFVILLLSSSLQWTVVGRAVLSVVLLIFHSFDCLYINCQFISPPHIARLFINIGETLRKDMGENLYSI